MRITEGQLRRIIREELLNESLLNEEVFGKMAFVYHGSQTSPENFVKMLVNDDFKPGLGAGAAYGKGLYTVYDLKGTPTAMGSYGEYIYKLAVNFDGFISFDPEATLKIYGSALTPAEQARTLGFGRKMVEKLEEVVPGRLPAFTSDVASVASKFLAGAVKGIIFTGRGDGKVAVIFDASVVVPTSYRRAVDSEWIRIEKDTLRTFRGRASGEWKPEKYQKDPTAEIERLENFLERLRANRGPAPADLVFDGDVDLSKQNLTELPVGSLHVKGDFYPGATMKTLPANLRVDGHIDMLESQVESIPSGLFVGKDLTPPSQVKTAEGAFTVGGDFRAAGTLLEEIPVGSVVGGNADFESSRIRKLPDDFTVGGNLILKWTPILELPRGLKVGGTLDLRGTNVFTLPRDLEVGDRIYMDELDRSTIPPHMKGTRDKRGMRKIWAA
jgi:hypothetical protein